MSREKTNLQKRGFTLIELLLVIGILAVLLSIVLIAINPARQFAQANNTKRSSDIEQLLSAIRQYQVDTRGTLPAGITSTAQDIASNGANICQYIMPTYISALPVDPTVNSGTPVTNCAANYDTGYTVQLDPASTQSGRIIIAAPHAQLGQTISLTQ